MPSILLTFDRKRVDKITHSISSYNEISTAIIIHNGATVSAYTANVRARGLGRGDRDPVAIFSLFFVPLSSVLFVRPSGGTGKNTLDDGVENNESHTYAAVLAVVRGRGKLLHPLEDEQSNVCWHDGRACNALPSRRRRVLSHIRSVRVAFGHGSLFTYLFIIPSDGTRVRKVSVTGRKFREVSMAFSFFPRGRRRVVRTVYVWYTPYIRLSWRCSSGRETRTTTINDNNNHNIYKVYFSRTASRVRR